MPPWTEALFLSFMAHFADMDSDGDGFITGMSARACVLMCLHARLAGLPLFSVTNCVRRSRVCALCAVCVGHGPRTPAEDVHQYAAAVGYPLSPKQVWELIDDKDVDGDGVLEGV
jgi:hypothetical protein